MWGILASATFQNLPGALYSASTVFTNAQIAPSLGRNLAACGAAAVCTATNTLTVTDPVMLAESRLNQFDFRVSKTIHVGHMNVKPNIDFYNVFNNSAILQDNNTFNAQWPRPINMLTGRLFKIGADIDWK